MLKGKNVNLRIMEKEDLPLFAEWGNDLGFWGEFEFIPQMSRADIEKMYASTNWKWFFVEKKDGGKIGTLNHRPVGMAQELGATLLSKERGKGYGSEAIMIMVDYLFLTKDTVRIQAYADVENVASQRVLGKAGFKKEGVARKWGFARGEWKDMCVFSILREEWKEPRILTGTT